jgi:hypothetical protein
MNILFLSKCDLSDTVPKLKVFDLPTHCRARRMSSIHMLVSNACATVHVLQILVGPKSVTVGARSSKEHP